MKGTYRHVKGGVYEVLFEGKNEADLTNVVIYRSLADDKVWVRPRDSFLERFTKIEEVE